MRILPRVLFIFTTLTVVINNCQGEQCQTYVKENDHYYLCQNGTVNFSIKYNLKNFTWDAWDQVYLKCFGHNRISNAAKITPPILTNILEGA